MQFGTVQLSTLARRAVRPLGVLLFVLAVIYVGRSVVSAWDELSNWSPTPALLSQLIGLALAYGVVSLFTMLVWLNVLGSIVEIKGQKRRLGKIHALSQLAKYLPGNVFHFAGRHMMSIEVVGGSGMRLGGAVLLEASVLVAAALVVSGFLGIAYMPPDLGFDFIGADLVDRIVVALLALLAASLVVVIGMKKARPQLLKSARLLEGFFFACCFFVGQAAILLLVVRLVTGEWLAWSLAVAPIAWFLGFVVPGAPAGMGVREAVMLGLFATTLATSDAILVSLLFRVVTVVGDFIFFLFGAAVPVELIGVTSEQAKE